MNAAAFNLLHFDHVARNRVRLLMNALAVLSTVTCVASVMLWAWSYWRFDSYVPASPGWCVQSYHGSIHYIQAGAGAGLGGPGLTSVPIAKARIWEDWYIRRNNRFAFLGFKSIYLEGRCSVVAVPYWFIATVSAMFALWWRGQVQRQRRRFPRGLCPECGYDIRGYPDHCPECGRLIGYRVPAVRVRERGFSAADDQGSQSTLPAH